MKTLNREALDIKRLNVEPLDDRVIVFLEDVESQSSGGIFIPEDSRRVPTKGTVLAVGPGRWREKRSRIDGKLKIEKWRQPIDVQVGDEIIFIKYCGDPLPEEFGEGLEFIHADNILAVLTPEAI